MATKPPGGDNQGTSTRPYLLRALHDWCTDNGFTPYVAVHVDASVQVPLEYVKNQEIVLNIGFEATSGLKLGNELIEFRARFGGSARDIAVPVDHVVAIYARENGQGMAFPAPADGGGATSGAAPGPRSLRLARSDGDEPHAQTAPEPEPPRAVVSEDDPPPDPAPPAGRPALKRVK
ncbi:MAG: ClpXP protease specificity-enhancing factor [Rubrivivax sp.]